MRVLLTSLGSTGDSQPFLALASELRKNNHEPILALPPHAKNRARSMGFEFIDFATEIDKKEISALAQAQINSKTPADQVTAYLDATMHHVPDMYKQLLDLHDGVDALVSTPFHIAARMLFDKTNIPFTSIHLSPFGSSGGRSIRDISAGPVNDCREKFGLAPLDDPLGADAASPQLGVFAVSRHIFRPPANWPSNNHLTGFFFLEENSWEPDEDLKNFIEAGEPPIVVSFGSMPHSDPEEVAQVLMTAIAQCGQRAIVQRGWSQLSAVNSENIYVTSYAPHSWLFPKASCVIHHGGAGTTAATLRAGVPAVIVPHLSDQPIWAEYVRAHRCAGGVVHINQLSSEKIAKAIDAALSKQKIKNSCQKMADNINRENGVAEAVKLIENL